MAFADAKRSLSHICKGTNSPVLSFSLTALYCIQERIVPVNMLLWCFCVFSSFLEPATQGDSSQMSVPLLHLPRRLAFYCFVHLSRLFHSGTNTQAVHVHYRIAKSKSMHTKSIRNLYCGVDSRRKGLWPCVGCIKVRVRKHVRMVAHGPDPVPRSSRQPVIDARLGQRCPHVSGSISSEPLRPV